jgi:hypothetical protein
MALTFDASRARAVDLISLPATIPGTSCSNCYFYRNEPTITDRSIGYCSHMRVRMNVSPRWCCNEWSRPDAPLASPALARRRFAARRLLSRLGR